MSVGYTREFFTEAPTVAEVKEIAKMTLRLAYQKGEQEKTQLHFRPFV
jgi:hypothetical protein